MSSVCIVSIARPATGLSSDPLVDRAHENKRAYCRACGYRCLLSGSTFARHSRHPSWDKILALQEAFREPDCHFVAWLDADVVMLRGFDLRVAMRTPFVGANDYGGLNSGVLLLARTPDTERLLRLVWEQDGFDGTHGPGSREQAAFKHVLRRMKMRGTILDNLVKYNPRTGFQGWRAKSVKRNRTRKSLTPIYHQSGCPIFAKNASSPAGNPSFCSLPCCRKAFDDYLGLSRIDGCPALAWELLAPRPMAGADTLLTAAQRGAVKPSRINFS